MRPSPHPEPRLIGYGGGVFFFRYAHGQRIAVSRLTAKLSKLADIIMASDASLISRARCVADNEAYHARMLRRQSDTGAQP